MDLEEKVKNLEGCLKQTNKRLDGLADDVKSLNYIINNDYSRICIRLNKLETPPRKWWQRIKFEI